LARGYFADIPWHIEKGFSPLRRLHITATPLPKAVSGEVPKDPWEGATFIPTNNDLHRRMVELHNEGFSYKDIASKMLDEGTPMSWEKVRYHLSRQCACVITAEASKPSPSELPGSSEQ